MSIVSLRLNKNEEELFKSYSIHTGKTLSELFKTALAEQIEDQLDYETGIKALNEFKKNPVTLLMTLLRSLKMTYRLVVSDKVKKQLKKMDKHVRLMLAKDMKKHLDGVENPRQMGKALTGQFKGLWRYRIGNYRVICDIIDDDLVILAIEVGHRKDIYKN